MLASSTSVQFVRSSSVGKVNMATKCSLAGKVAFAAIARCACGAVADAGTTFLIAKSAGRVLFRALSGMYSAASITILGVDK